MPMLMLSDLHFTLYYTAASVCMLEVKATLYHYGMFKIKIWFEARFKWILTNS